jgi:predicted DNA-binding protein (UPF0251 family)
MEPGEKFPLVLSESMIKMARVRGLSLQAYLEEISFIDGRNVPDCEPPLPLVSDEIPEGAREHHSIRTTSLDWDQILPRALRLKMEQHLTPGKIALRLGVSRSTLGRKLAHFEQAQRVAA